MIFDLYLLCVVSILYYYLRRSRKYLDTLDGEGVFLTNRRGDIGFWSDYVTESQTKLYASRRESIWYKEGTILVKQYGYTTVTKNVREAARALFYHESEKRPTLSADIIKIETILKERR